MPKALADFAVETNRQKRRAGCLICSLPPAIRKQIDSANMRGADRTNYTTSATVSRWLKTEHQLDVTAQAVESHKKGRHGTA